MRNKCNLTNCPHTPARFLSPVPPQRGGGKDKRHPDKQEKTQLNSKRGRKSTVTRSSKHNWSEGQQHQPQAGIALGESRSSAARRAEQGARQGSILDCTWKSTPAPPIPLLTQPREHTTSPLFLPWRSRTKATADFAAQEAPTAKPSSGTAPEDSVGTEVPLLLTCQT